MSGGFDRSLVAAIEMLDPISWEGRVWRHMFNAHPPEKPNVTGARWNPRDVAAIYVALDRETAIAEGQHAIDSQPLRPRARRFVYELELSAQPLIDLTSVDIRRDRLTPHLSVVKP